jgi:hypothetical protein
MTERKPVTPEPQYQEIRENGLVLPIILLPSFLRRLFVSNVFTRTFAQLLGWTGTKNVLLTATEAGYLKVSSTGTINEHNATFAGNAPNAYGAAIDLGRLCPTVDIFTWDFACMLKRSLDDVTYDTELEIPANFFYSFDCDTRYLKIVNKVALSVCRYSIIGWY